MSQITNGLRRVLSFPGVYDAFQNLMGTPHIRQELVRDFMLSTPKIRVLDIGCGTADIVNILPQETEYWGYDISPEYIASAQRRFGPRARFHCGLFDMEQVAILPKFDLVIAIGVLHHLGDDEARNLFVLAKQALCPGGRVVTVDPCFTQNQNPIAHFLIARDRGQNVRTADTYRALPGANFGTVGGRLRQRQPIPYTDWIMACS